MEVCVKRASFLAALCFLLLPVVGLADEIDFTGPASGSTMSLGTTSGGSVSGTIEINNATGNTTVSHSGGGGYAITGTALGAGTGTLTIQGNTETVSHIGNTTNYSFTLTQFNLTGYLSGQLVTMTLTPGDGTTLDFSCIRTGTVGHYGSSCSASLDLTAVNNSAGSDSVNAALAAFFGEPTLPVSNLSNWALTGQFGGSSTQTCLYMDNCSGSKTLASVTNSIQDVSGAPIGTPEPATLSLLGAGLIGLLGLTRRRRS